MGDQSNETSCGNRTPSPSRPEVNPKPRNRPETGTQAPRTTASAPGAAGASVHREPTGPGDQHNSQPSRRGKARKDENGKWQPTGDYEVGFGRPPVATRFAGKPGPGRPKGSVSYDTLMAKHLGQRSKVRINGHQKVVSHAELIVMSTVKDAIEGKRRDARKQVLTEMARLMTPTLRDAGISPKDLNDADRLTLEEFHRDVRAQILAEIGLDPAERADGAGEES